MITINIERFDNDYGFLAVDQSGKSIRMDAGKAFGGNNQGVSPMQALLMALGACSGIDIVSILKKQKQPLDIFKMTINGEREVDKEPALWKKVDIIYQFSKSTDIDKALKACSLSIDKYCSVAATLRAAGCIIEYRVEHL